MAQTKTKLEEFVDLYDEFMSAKENEKNLKEDPHKQKYIKKAIEHSPAPVDKSVWFSPERVRNINDTWKDDSKRLALENGADNLDSILASFDSDDLFVLAAKSPANREYKEAAKLHQTFSYYQKVVAQFQSEEGRNKAIQEMNGGTKEKGGNLENVIKLILEESNKERKSQGAKTLSKKSISLWSKCLAGIAQSSPDYAARLYSIAGNMYAARFKNALGGTSGMKSYILGDIKDINERYDEAKRMMDISTDPDEIDYYDNLQDKLNDIREGFYQTLYESAKPKQEAIVQSQIPKKYRQAEAA